MAEPTESGRFLCCRGSSCLFVVVVGVHTPGDPGLYIYVQRVRCPGAHWVGSADVHLRFVEEGGDGLPRLGACFVVLRGELELGGGAFLLRGGSQQADVHGVDGVLDAFDLFLCLMYGALCRVDVARGVFERELGVRDDLLGIFMQVKGGGQRLLGVHKRGL